MLAIIEDLQLIPAHLCDERYVQSLRDAVLQAVVLLFEYPSDEP